MLAVLTIEAVSQLRLGFSPARAADAEADAEVTAATRFAYRVASLSVLHGYFLLQGHCPEPSPSASP